MTTEHSPLAIWIIFVAAGLATYLIRLSFIPIIGKVDEVSPRIKGVLRFIPAAVFAALVLPLFLSVSVSPQTIPVITYEPAELLAGSVAAIVAWRTKNIVATITVGIAVLWSIQVIN